MILRAASGECIILIGTAGRLQGLIDGGRSFAIVDGAARRLHPDRIPKMPGLDVRGGESVKSMATAEKAYKAMAKAGVDRSWTVVGIGGGAVCDLAGFVAATYHRGVPLGLVPTTLLAQVDAAIGGKGALNLGGSKNTLGTVRQPRFVLCDTGFLVTLPKKGVLNGLAEMIKCACVSDAALFRGIENDLGGIIELKPSPLKRAMTRAIAAKCRIVEADENDAGERLKLNFGHTIGHAVESAARLPHGEAVAFGMLAEAGISTRRGGFPDADRQSLEGLVRKAGFSTRVGAVAFERAKALLRADKKRRGVALLMPVLKRIGESRILEITFGELEAALDDMR